MAVFLVMATAGVQCVAAIGDRALQVTHFGANRLQLGASYPLDGNTQKRLPNRRAVSLTSGDVDGDGFPDLVSGYATDSGGVITLHRGNVEAWAPSTPESLALVAAGRFPSGFESVATEFAVPVAPDFMVSGDFNGDGRADIVFAQRGDRNVYFLAGQRRGFAPAMQIKLEGGVDALASGRIDSRDGFPKLVAAVSSLQGASLLTFTQGMNAPATPRALAAPVEALAIGKLSADSTGDIVILSAGRVHIAHGTHGPNGVAASSPTVPLETLSATFSVRSFALGEFIWDRAGATKIALLADDGAIHVAARADIDTRPFTVDEVRTKRREQQSGAGAALTRSKAAASAWQFVRVAESRAGPSGADAAPQLLRARLSNLAADDILVIDALKQTVDILTDESSGRKRYSVSASVSASQAPVAVLSLQTSAFVLPSLVVLGQGAAAPSVAPPVPLALFTVTKTADTNDGVCDADCSLREAISAANAAGGAHTISVPAGTYTLTRANAGGVNEDNNATGDLDINNNVTLVGAGAATTIIQAGTTTSNGIDKVIAVNPICVSPMNVSISGVTIRFGRNTQPTSAPDFSYTGGGIDVCSTGSGGFTMTNVVVDQNTNTTAYGGGVNFDTFAANGTFAIVGSTINGNRTLSPLGNNTGGGINLFGDQHNVNITNSTIGGNTSAGEGGGVVVRHTNGGAITISGTTISGNTAASRGGGISNINLAASSLAIVNDSAILNNVSQGTAASTESRGGGIFIFVGTAANTTTITETTFAGNQANTGTFQGGGAIGAIVGTVNATFNRIAGNLAGTSGGSGIHNAGAAINAANNWWGCNAGPGSAPCDRSINTSGTLTTAPRLTLRHSASPSTIVVGQSSTLTADFLQNSTPAAVALANLDAMIGTPIAFNSPLLGTLSAAQTVVQAAGTATATFTGTSNGAGSASSVVDSQAIAAAITINQASTTTTITSDLPDPSNLNAAVIVNYTVAVNAPGAGTPTGNVVVTVSGGAETCTGTVAAGTCSITLTNAGARTLTATYSGDANFTASSDTEPHTVNALPTLSINDVTVSEGNAGTQTMTFTVTRTGTTASTVTFNYATADGTATAPSDYVATSGTGSIPSGGTMAITTISVTIKGDTLLESNETFFVNLSSPVNATIADAQGIGTITNDDVAVTITTLTLPNPSTGVAYSQTVAASGGGGPYSFIVASGTLPTGITLASGGTLSGTTNQVGVFNITIFVTDSNGQTASRPYTLTVAAPTLTLTPPAGALTATFGSAYSQTFTAGGSAGPFGYVLTGALPSGLSFTGGTLSGTPAVAGAYPISVAATDTVITGTGAPFSVSRNYTLTVNATAPGAPTIGAATPGNAQASIAFTAPASNGGSAIISYTVTCNAGGITGTGPTSPITVMGLTNGTTYNCSVVATNGVGPGAASATVAVTPVTVPGAPTIGAATPGNAQASIAFTAPASTGGSTIISYTVTCNAGGITGTGPTSPITVSGLNNGTTYNCSVVATNGVGPGTASATVAVTPVSPTCAAGTWSVSGTAPCAPAAPGYFVASSGAMMQTPCVPGTYQATSGQVACVPAQAGFYAAGPAAIAQLPCALGSTSGASAAVCTRLPLLNIDDSDAPDIYSPSTDGTLLLRYLFGLRGSALTAGALGTNTRRNAGQIVTHIETYITLFDVDGDGQTRALTDGVMILRRMLGLSGSALTAGVKNSLRTDDAVRDAIDALKP